MSDSVTVNEGGIIAFAAILISIPLAIASFEPGPSWLWITDACPNVEGVCGVVPLGLFISVVGVALLLSVILGSYLKGKEGQNSEAAD